MAEVSSIDLKELYEGEDYLGRYHVKAGKRISRIVDRVELTVKDKVLDVGCGNALLLSEIIEKINHYDGVDFSRAFIKEANSLAGKRRIPKKRYELHAGDVVDFCKSRNNYDKVFALDFTEHINDKELIDIFSNVKKSMKKGSHLVIHTPNKDYILERIKSERAKNKQGHIGLRNGREYERLFKEMGFKKIKVIPLNHYLAVLKPLHIISYIPVKKISTLFQARLLIICEA